MPDSSNGTRKKKASVRPSYAWIAEPLQGLAVPVADLVPDAANARKHSPRNLDAIEASMRRWGQRQPIVVQAEGMIVRAGNARLEVAKRLGWTHVAALVVPDSDVEATAYAIADNRTAELAEWDDEVLQAVLASLDGEEAIEAIGFDAEEIEEWLTGDEKEEGKYTVKVASPIYEPTMNEPPPISDLLDRTKTRTLIEEIEAAELPPEVADFLMVAAERHTVFDYSKIAEWYCHAPAAVRALAERSGLVIIDFNAAIANGFVEMTETIRQLAEREETDDDA